MSDLVKELRAVQEQASKRELLSGSSSANKNGSRSSISRDTKGKGNDELLSGASKIQVGACASVLIPRQHSLPLSPFLPIYLSFLLDTDQPHSHKIPMPTQDLTMSSINRSTAMIAESQELGEATIENLVDQRRQIGDIGSDIKDIDSNLTRAEKLITDFARRMARDRLIQGM